MFVKIENFFQLGVLLSIWLIASIVLMWLGGSWILSFIGFFCWPVIEWLGHRYAHLPFYQGAHMNHHMDRRDFKFQIVPQWQALGLALIIWLIMGSAFTGGLLLAYTLYEGIHELTHVKGAARWAPQPLRWMIIHHLRHHAKPNTNFSVTLPVIDWILGSSYEQRKKK